MRKLTKYSLAITLALAAIGCTKELEITEPVGKMDQGGELIFFASNENDDGKEQTKTVLGDNGLTVTFVDGDIIKIYDGTNSGDYTTNSTDNETGLRMFTGSGVLNDDAASYYAVYPSSAAGGYSTGNLTATIPAEQYAPLNSFDPAANVSVAKGDNIETGKYNLKFKNVGNLLKFTFTEDSEVSAIIIKGNGGESLVGTVTVDPVSAERTGSITSGSNQITLKPSGSGTFQTGSYYAVVIPQTFANGVSVKMEHGSGSYHFKRGNKADVQMARNKIYQLFSGSLENYKEAAVLPSLYMHNGNPHNGISYDDLNEVTRISFHTMAQDVDWNYADANNILNVMGTSDVRGYVEGATSILPQTNQGMQYNKYIGGTLHIWTKKGMFSIPENDIIAGTNDGCQMFNGYETVTAIDNLSYIDVTFLQSFKSMFAKCNKLQRIDISGWDTSSATSMESMISTSSTSDLRDVILGDWFVLSNPETNMFGPNSMDRGTGKIRVSCPANVYQQFVDFTGYAPGDELYNKQVTWNQGSSATAFGEFLNPTIMHTSVGEEVNFTFTLGGYFDNSSLGDLTVGFDGYTPIGAQFTSIGQQNIDGVDYDMYKLELTADQKHDRRVIAKVRAQDTAQNPTHVILQHSPLFSDAKIESLIYAHPFTAHVEVADNVGDKASPNFISGLNANYWMDYSGDNWPIAGQSCNVTFYLKADHDMEVASVKLRNGTKTYDCSKSGSGAPAGYTAYTANNVFVSNTAEVKSLKVFAQLQGERQLYEAGDFTVNVYGITLGTGMTTATEFSANANTTDVYVIKSNISGRFLFTDGYSATSSVKTKAQDMPDNFCFWKLNPAKSPVKLLTYNTSTQRYLTSGNQASDRSGNAVALTVSEGLKFANGTKYLREAMVTGPSVTATSFSSSAGQNEWTVYPVTFTSPTPTP